MAYEDFLVFHAQGASEPQRNRGLAAAKEYFAAANVDPWSAIEAISKRDQWDLSGFDPDLEPSDEDARALNAWDRATEFAIAACFPNRAIGSRHDAYLPFDAGGEWIRPASLFDP